MLRYLIAAAILVGTAAQAIAGNCHHLFRQHVGHRPIQAVNYGHALNHAYGHHYIQPQILYLVGQQLVQDAHIRKVAADEWQRRGSQQQTQQTQQAPVARPAGPQPVAGGSGAELLQTYCAKCHQGGNSVNAEKFDLDAGIRLSAYKAYTIMAGRGEQIPDGMEGVMKKLTPEQKGLIMEALQDMTTLPEEIAATDSTETGELR